MDEHATTNQARERIYASLPGEETMELLCLGIDDIAISGGVTREMALGQLALDAVITTLESRLARGEDPLPQSTVREMIIAGLDYATIIDADPCYHPLAEAACLLLKTNNARIRTDLTDEEITELERLASLAYANVDGSTDAPDVSMVSLPSLALRLLEVWDEDEDGIDYGTTACADLATIVRLSEPSDDCPEDRGLLLDALGWSWDDYQKTIGR